MFIQSKLKRFNMSKLLVHCVLILFSVFCILPLILTISISLTSESEIQSRGYHLIPDKIDFTAYSFVFKHPEGILHAYMITIIVTVVGTILGTLFTAFLGYVISRKDYAYAKSTSFFTFFPMLFTGGLIPSYILITQVLGMKDSILALILPLLILPWHVLLMKGFMSNISLAIIESAKIDGANEWRIFFKIIMPISMPGIATIAFFTTLVYWNDYFQSLMYIQNSNNVTLQLFLYRILSNIDFLNSALALKSGVNLKLDELPGQSARMAICILAAGPMLLVFPFFQKYLEKGMTVGAVKG